MDLNFIESLLADTSEDEPSTSRFHSIQNGPLRWYDKEMRCAKRNCRSSTFLKLRGVATCQMHALREMNEMLIECQN